MPQLVGKSARVTGGSRGIGRAIGRAIVHRLTAEGAAVTFSCLSNVARS